MRVAILTLGTRGDVQPYVALAQGLINAGHSAVICTGESFKEFITKHGVEFAKADSDLMAILNTSEGQAIFNHAAKHIFKTLKYVKEVLNPSFRKSLDDFWQCSQGADIIIYHPKALGAVDMALALDIPCISMPPVPITFPVKEFPNLAISPTKNLGKTLNKLSYIVVKKAEASNIKEINNFRDSTLHLPKRKAGIYTYKRGNEFIPIIYPLSKELFPDVKTWSERVYLPGFFFLENKEQKLDDKIELFIGGGVKPIVVSFSSMPLRNPEVFKNNLIEALQRTNNRAIVLTGSSGMTFNTGQNILAIREVPHNLLFPRAKGIIHHGGVGTMTMSLCSGRPQFIMPFSVDQPFWANRLYKMGYVLKPIKEKELSSDVLVNVFIEMDKEENINQAEKIKNIIMKENGIKDAVSYIEAIYQKSKK